MTTVPYFPPKDPDSTQRYQFDYRDILGENEIILSAEVTITCDEEADDDPEAMLGGRVPVASDKAVDILLEAGTEDVEYTLQCLATTDLAQVISITRLLVVEKVSG